MAAVNPQVAGILATAIAGQTIQTLVQKGVITNDEGLAIYQGALNVISDPSEKEDAKTILRGMMTGIVIP